MSGLTLSAPAKINLGLLVRGKRPDGYHEIETVLQTVSLYDEIFIEEGGEGIELTLDTPGLPTGKENLVVRAAGRFYREIGKTPHLRIGLKKKIPVGAGLGGGSSDAAATLAALNRLRGNPLPLSRLMELAAELGMDVPFFLFSATALATGRGEKLQRLPSPSPPLWILLVHPGFHISTKKVYQGVKLGLTTKNKHISIRRFLVTTFTRGHSVLSNDLERVTFEAYPRLREIKETILDLGALEGAMSGSGSTLFGIFPDREAACAAGTELENRKGLSVTLVHTLDTIPA
ncbi:MAG: 4-(cytidine 5'-diphospho)-2-C-methyl-D-erythritol kinase [Deltaproteobacteria bacterium]|nr:4-(cytidine 5'-diphospho)-2-C-methyl-D-erythritol kinase [Deltaproteobacteria bacterium]